MSLVSSATLYGSTTTDHRIDIPQTSKQRSYSSSSCCMSRCWKAFCELTIDFSCVGIWCKYYTVAALSTVTGIVVDVTVSESNNGPSIGTGLIWGGVGMGVLGCAGCCFYKCMEQSTKEFLKLPASERERVLRSQREFNQGLENVNRGNALLKQEQNRQWQIRHST